MLVWAWKAILLSCGLLVVIDPAQRWFRFWGPSLSSGFTRFWCPCIIVLTCCHILQSVGLVTEAVGHGPMWQCVTACCCGQCVGTTYCSCYPWREAVCVWCIHWWAVLSSRMTRLWSSYLAVGMSALLVECSVVGICLLLYHWTSLCVLPTVAHSITLAVSSWFGYALISAARFGRLDALSWSMAEIESQLRLHAGRLVAYFLCLMAWLIFCKHVFKCSFKIWGFVDAQPWMMAMIDGRSVSIKLSVPFPFTRIVVLVW